MRIECTIATAAKTYLAGTHRVVAPEVTLARVQPLLPVFGITRVGNVTGLDHVGIPVVMVTRPNACSLAVAQGKGTSLVAAKVSGLMESIESWHAETILAPLKLASANDLRFTHRLADLDRLPRVADTRFDPDQPILWIEAVDLGARGGAAWLPFEVVHTRYTLPLPPQTGTFQMTSSGLASGNHVDEAIVHALCELIERDAATRLACLPEAGRLARRVDHASIDDASAAELIARFADAGLGVAIWDMTTDVGVAAFRADVCELRPDPMRPLGPMGGFGCHPARAVALSRALTEAAQSRLTRIAGSRDDLEASADKTARYHAAVAEFAAAAAATDAAAAATPPPRHFADAPDRVHATVDEDVQHLLAALAAAGLREVLVVDLTRREIGLPVVRVVVPGLEALSVLPGWVPGERAHAVST